MSSRPSVIRWTRAAASNMNTPFTPVFRLAYRLENTWVGIFHPSFGITPNRHNLLIWFKINAEGTTTWKDGPVNASACPTRQGHERQQCDPDNEGALDQRQCITHGIDIRLGLCIGHL